MADAVHPLASRSSPCRQSRRRNFSSIFRVGCVLRCHRGIVRPPVAIIGRSTRGDRADLNLPGNRFNRGFRLEGLAAQHHA